MTERRRRSAQSDKDAASARPDDTGELAIVGDDAIRAGMLLRMAESDRSILLAGLAASAVVVGIYWTSAPAWLLVAFSALRLAATLHNHLTCRAVVRLGAAAAYREGYLGKLELATFLTAISWSFTALFFESPVLEHSATVLGLLALVAIQGIILLITSFSRRAMVLLVSTLWVVVSLRIIAIDDPHKVGILVAGLIYECILLRFGFALHRQMVASVRSNLVSDVLLQRVSALHARMRAQRDELAAVNTQLTAALDLSIELAAKDSLTGVLNRRAFQDRLTTDRRALRLGSEPSALLLLDFDFFKAINDTHGHSAGDAVLAQCARALREELRPLDVFARWGGEEFIALLPCTSLQDAERVAERLRRAVSETRHPSWPAGVSVTASIGVAALDPQDGFDACLAAADHALYRAKAEGRNVVRVAARTP